MTRAPIGQGGQGSGAPADAGRATAASQSNPSVSSKAGIPSADDHDPYWDYDDEDCANCGGEGFTYGCSWDWQCDTYDGGEGTCLCTRPCEWCRPCKPNPELQKVLGDALKAAADEGNAP